MKPLMATRSASSDTSPAAKRQAQKCREASGNAITLHTLKRSYNRLESVLPDRP
jgi:hypothetical protein